MSSVDAGDGQDTITAGAGWTLPLSLRGGPGDDTLTGGGGPDSLHGGEGRDRLDGRAGEDTVSYADRRAGVTVDLAAGRAGEDAVSGLEVVVGGAGDDRITGDSGPNELYGGRGRDVLRGGGGNDLFETRDGTADRVVCGAGIDRVTGYEDIEDDLYGESSTATTGPDAQDVLDRSCEHVESDSPTTSSTSGR